MKFREYITEGIGEYIKEDSALPDDIFDELSNGSEAGDSLVKEIGEFVQKNKPTLKNTEKLMKMAKRGKYTHSLAIHLAHVTVSTGPAFAKELGYKNFDKGQVNFLKSLFDQVRQAATYFD